MLSGSDVRAAFAHAGGLRVSWLGVAVAAEVVSLAGGAAAQRRLLSAAGVSLPWRTVSGVVFASTGLARMMPAGPVAGGAWQAAEYRCRGAGAAAGLWAVLAGGLTSTVAVSGLLLAGAAVAGTGSLALLAGAADEPAPVPGAVPGDGIRHHIHHSFLCIYCVPRGGFMLPPAGLSPSVTRRRCGPSCAPRPAARAGSR
jgi:hypothetical protein